MNQTRSGMGVSKCIIYQLHASCCFGVNSFIFNVDQLLTYFTVKPDFMLLQDKLQACPTETDYIIKCMNKNPEFFLK